MSISGQSVSLTSYTSAKAECYFLGGSAALNIAGDTEAQFIGGRYLDDFEKRGSEWRVSRRVLICDFRYMDVARTETAEGFAAALTDRGRLGPDHPLYWKLTRR